MIFTLLIFNFYHFQNFEFIHQILSLLIFKGLLFHNFIVFLLIEFIQFECFMIVIQLIAQS